ncbi:MAG TPA: NAD-dependent epimerase/dehydratase family protein [Thermoanaerobaculia bacterium]|jgi:nucleoside-diphosphate-sugar epimerase
MRIFMTGATGYIGGEVAAALTRAGHEVAALVRPDAEARHLRDLGVFIVTGDLAALPTMGETLANYDTFVHTAQPSKDAEPVVRAASEALTAQSGHLVYTSGVWVLGNTDGADENAPVNPIELVSWRPAIEEQALAGGGAVIRPGCVYGGKQSLFADWFASAEQQEPLRIVGDGTNRWALVDLHDLATLYVLAVEQRATGVLHGIDDSDSTLEACARAVAPEGTISKTPLAEAREKLGPFADALAIDQRISSSYTRQKLGWTPRRTFVASIDEQWREWREATKG